MFLLLGTIGFVENAPVPVVIVGEKAGTQGACVGQQS